MAAIAKNRKFGKKSLENYLLKLLGPNYGGMVFRWSSFKIVSDDPQQWLPSSLVGGVVGYNSEKGPSKDHFTIVWAHLTKQFQRRSFLGEVVPFQNCVW
jgi:hypothetical protein